MVASATLSANRIMLTPLPCLGILTLLLIRYSEPITNSGLAFHMLLPQNPGNFVTRGEKM